MKTAASILWTAIITSAGYLYMPVTPPQELATMFQHGHYGAYIDHMRVNCGSVPCVYDDNIKRVHRYHRIANGLGH